MPVERQNWLPLTGAWDRALDRLNGQLRRAFEVFDACDRYDVQPINVTGTLVLKVPLTLVETDTTGGGVDLTLPGASTVPGYRVDFSKTAGGPSFTVNGVTVTAFAGWISTGAEWHRVA